MRDKSAIEMETLFEKHYILKENEFESGLASRMAGKPVERVITAIVELIDLGLGDEIPQSMIAQVKGEEKIGVLIKAIQDRKLKVPQEVAHALTDDGMGDLAGAGDTEGVVSDMEAPDERKKELDFSRPRFNEIPDEDEDESEPGHAKVDPSMR